jgi:hypothetical protein
MDSLTFAVLAAQALGSLLVAVLLGLLYRSYNRLFLLYWSYSWAALAIYSASGPVAIRLSMFVAPSHPARLIQSFVSISAGLEASVWLLFGIFALASGRELPRRAALRFSLAASLVAAVVTAGTLGLPETLRYGVRVSPPELVLAIALTVAAWRVWNVPTRQRAAGRRLLALALELYGLEQLRYAADGIGRYLFGSRYPDLRIIGVADFFIQATIALAIVVWLLEDESDRLETSLRQEGHALDALHQSEARPRRRCATPRPSTGRRRKWRRSAGSRAGSRTTSTIWSWRSTVTRRGAARRRGRTCRHRSRAPPARLRTVLHHQRIR